MARVLRHLKILQMVSLFIGLVIFVYLIYRLGSTQILASFKLVGFGFVLLIFISAIRFLFRSLAWFYCIDPAQRNASLFTLFNARHAGDAVRLLSFTGPFLGEPSKAFLVRDRIPMSYGVSSIVVENLCFMLTGIFIIISGLLLMITNFKLQIGFILTGLAVCFFMGAVVYAVYFGITRRIKATAVAVAWVGKKTGFLWLENQELSVADTEVRIHDFYNRRGRSFSMVLLLEMIAHFIIILEIYLILYLINADVTIIVAYVIEAVGKVVGFMFFFVPGQIGVTEGSYAFLLEILGLGFATGVMLALVDKIRTIFWIGYGLIIWIIAFRKKAKQTTRDNAAIASEI